MTPMRFVALVDSYGGRIDLWPPDERDAARAYLLAHPDAGLHLDGAGKLDRVLAMWSADTGTAAAAVASSPARIARQVVARRNRLRRVGLFLSGFSAAAAVAAGAVAGIVGVALSGPPGVPTTSVYGLTVLGVPLDAQAAPSGDGSAPSDEASAPSGDVSP